MHLKAFFWDFFYTFRKIGGGSDLSVKNVTLFFNEGFPKTEPQITQIDTQAALYIKIVSPCFENGCLRFCFWLPLAQSAPCFRCIEILKEDDGDALEEPPHLLWIIWENNYKTLFAKSRNKNFLIQCSILEIWLSRLTLASYNTQYIASLLL